MATKKAPLAVACEERNWRAVAQLAPHATTDVLSGAISKDGWCPLHYAAAGGSVEAVAALTKAGAAPVARAVHGSSPLHLAAWEGHTAVAQALLAADADVEARSNAQRTPLHFAARRGEVDVLNLLLTSGADPSVAEHRGRTALHFAAREGHSTVAKYLIDAGADLDAADVDGITPAHEATRGGHLDITEMLLDAGASTEFDDGAAFPDIARLRRRSESTLSESTSMSFSEHTVAVVSNAANFIRKKSIQATTFVTGRDQSREPSQSKTKLVETLTNMTKEELAGVMSAHVARGQSQHIATEYSETVSRGVMRYNLTGDLLLSSFPSSETLASELLEAAGISEEKANRGALFSAIVNFINGAREAKTGYLLRLSSTSGPGSIRREVYAVVGAGILFSLLIPIVRSRSQA